MKRNSLTKYYKETKLNTSGTLFTYELHCLLLNLDGSLYSKVYPEQLLIYYTHRDALRKYNKIKKGVPGFPKICGTMQRVYIEAVDQELHFELDYPEVEYRLMDIPRDTCYYIDSKLLIHTKKEYKTNGRIYFN